MPYRGSTAAVVIRFISVQLDYGLISQSVLQMQFKPEHNQPFRNFLQMRELETPFLCLSVYNISSWIGPLGRRIGLF